MLRPDLRSIVVGVMSFVVGAHLVAVTATAVPPNAISDAIRPHTDYLHPYFAQNWRLFAPDPVDEDRGIRFQASYLDASGVAQHTAWVDWTEVEQDLVRRRIVGGRAGYVSTKFYGPLQARSGSLAAGQQNAARTTSDVAPLSWATLEVVLSRAGTDGDVVAGYLRYDRAAIRLATAVLQARWPDRDFTAIRYVLTEQDVVPYESRNLGQAQREAARPEPIRRVGGWRVPTAGGSGERDAIASFDRRHR